MSKMQFKNYKDGFLTPEVVSVAPMVWRHGMWSKKGGKRQRDVVAGNLTISSNRLSESLTIDAEHVDDFIAAIIQGREDLAAEIQRQEAKAAEDFAKEAGA